MPTLKQFTKGYCSSKGSSLLVQTRNFHQKNSSGRMSSSSSSSVATAAHELQNIAMKEQCILVDETDACLGQVSKRECHRVNNGQVMLHRAFSVFLFNAKGDMLMQQRSKYKITYPNHYTNACCSHPLYEVMRVAVVFVELSNICHDVIDYVNFTD